MLCALDMCLIDRRCSVIAFVRGCNTVLWPSLCLTPGSRLRACLCGSLCAFMLHAAASSIFVLVTFGQPMFKVLFNLSERCRGSEQHLNNTVSANILPSVVGEARKQSTIYSLPHQKQPSLYLGFAEKVYIYF